MATNEPLHGVDELWHIRGQDGQFVGYEDGYDDGFESDADETDGYEPEAYAIGPYRPPPRPWYRDPQAITAVGAIGVAVLAILVSTILLLVRPQRGPSTVVGPATPARTTTSAPTTIAGPAAPPPPPPSGAVTPGTVPVVVAPREPPGPSRSPEFNVTRTPVTRSPISVHPEPHRPGYGP